MSDFIYASKYVDFCAAHRLVGHEGKCANIHGHNYRVTLEVGVEREAMDQIYRVLDFAIIGECLKWIDQNWDHKFLIWEKDPLALDLRLMPGAVIIEGNPTAEWMAYYIKDNVAKPFLNNYFGQIYFVYKVSVEETRKCKVTTSC
jgi:6-pyruvoyltetrahydropterin/6-carboxytetrahydropterin synthase